MFPKCHIINKDLPEYIKAILGNDSFIEKIFRINGGAQKASYRARCNNGKACILQVWDDKCDYFQDEKLESQSIQASGSDIFEVNNKYLLQRGINTPKILHMDRSRKKYPFDFALVEFIDGGDSWSYFGKSEDETKKLFTNLGIQLKKLHSIKSDCCGNVKSRIEKDCSCEELIFNVNTNNLEYCAEHHEATANTRELLLHTLDKLYNKVKPRKEFSLIHGELSPNHVMVGQNMEAYLIDIEGLMYFDLEFEHSFLQFLSKGG